jgi:predicted alpha/beta hydrolase family esterase
LNGGVGARPDGSGVPSQSDGLLAVGPPLPRPSLASSDDPYGSLDHQRRAAGAWGATFIELGRLGHVNEASELGFWERGYELITAFRTGLAGQ